MSPIQTPYRRTVHVSRSVSPSRSVAPSLCPSISPSLSPSVSLSPPLLVSPSQILPRYDTDARILTVAGHVIAQLPAQARNLAAALAAIEQAGWPPRIASPLVGTAAGNDRHHLAMIVYKLNLRQRLIDFHADDGALCWNWRPAARLRED